MRERDPWKAVPEDKRLDFKVIAEPLARGQDVVVTPDQVLALERRITDLEAALQRMTNTFNPILHHGRTAEVWLDPTTGPVVTVTKDELGKIHFFIESGVGGGGDLHVAGAVVIEGDLTVKGAISSDPRRSDVHFTPRTAP